MLLKEYRVCMPMTVEEYRIGQLYMIAKHSHEQSEDGEGVEVVTNEECDHPEHGKGRFTEKRVYLSSRLPTWIRSLIPNIFYITEKAWNFYPFTITVLFKLCTNIYVFHFMVPSTGIGATFHGSSHWLWCYISWFLPLALVLHFMVPPTGFGATFHGSSLWHLCFITWSLPLALVPHFTATEYTCSFMPRFSVYIETKYANDNGCSDNVCGLSEEDLEVRAVEHLDIAYDEIPEKHYKEAEDPVKFKSKKTGRGPLEKEWKESTKPIMCSYKAVKVKFEVWGLQTKVEDFTHRCVRDVLLLGHRQAFTWIDEWLEMSIEDIREYEKKMHAETNEKVLKGSSV